MSNWTKKRFGLRGSVQVSPNRAPFVRHVIDAIFAFVGDVFSFTIPDDTFSAGDPGQTVSLDVSGLPPGLVWNGDTSTISGTPTSSGTFNLVIVATDDGKPPLSADTSFSISLNTRPIYTNALPSLLATVGQPFSYTIPANTFTDPDPGQTITYSVANLPPGLIYDPATRTVSGSPTDGKGSPPTVTAADNGIPQGVVTVPWTLVVPRISLDALQLSICSAQNWHDGVQLDALQLTVLSEQNRVDGIVLDALQMTVCWQV